MEPDHGVTLYCTKIKCYFKLRIVEVGYLKREVIIINFLERSLGALFLILVIAFIYRCNPVFACSRVLSAENGQAVLVGRNMDWPEDTGTALWVLPRGIKRDSQAGNNLITWTSKYGSIVAASYLPNGKGSVADGINEKGLTANLLWLSQSDYGARDEKRLGLLIAYWAQYMLDNYSTVNEAVQAIKKDEYQLVTYQFPGMGGGVKTAALHLSLADKTGDSAIIEYIAGKPVIHHDRRNVVMTNDPPFEKQEENLKQYQEFGGNQPIPGTNSALDRFVRASYYMKLLPKPHNLREALAGVISVTRNISQPFRNSVDPENPFSSTTIWRSTADLTNLYYYFEMTNSPFLIWASLTDFNLKKGSPAMVLDLRKYPDYYGNVSKYFVEKDPSEIIYFSLQ